jgi:hypothetical protein
MISHPAAQHESCMNTCMEVDYDLVSEKQTMNDLPT